MPFLEQFLFGGDHRRDPSARGVLGTSAGLGTDVVAELERLCRGWGDPPPLGLDRPALLSFPLTATMPSIRGRLYAVIHVGTGHEPLFHAVVLGDPLFATFDRNPWLLARQLAFTDQWRPGATPPRVELERDSSEPPAGLVPGPADRGFIDEAVVQHVLAGKLLLPLEATGSDSDRALALMIAGLPVKLRREMRFASLAMSAANGYTLAALATPGAAFAGWQRLLHSVPNSGLTAELAAYQEALGQALVAGDLTAVARVALRQEYAPAARPEPIVTAVHDRRPAVEPRPLQTPLAAVVSPAGRPGAPAADPSVGSYGSPRAPRDDEGRRPGGATARPPRADTLTAAVAGGPTPPRSPFTTSGSAAAASGPEVPYRVAPRTLAGARRPVSDRPWLARALAVVFVLFLAGGVATLRINGRTLASSLDWAGTPGLESDRAGDPHGATLLDVVDVGRVYDEQRQALGGNRGRLGPSPDQARRKALANLTSKAAAPLVAEIGLFVDLSDAGIRQGSRPDRETERLRALARQGEVLGNELKRLELAWYSLAAGAAWPDLATLPDAAVAARGDSLTRRDRTALDEARVGMALNSRIRDLAAARRNVAGMASLVELFGASGWSPRWAADLKAAADLVSPSASPLTRAYRNGAFQLLRLKEAERTAASRALPYADVLSPQTWPAPGVRVLLPELRRAAGAFTDGDAPALISGTLRLYADLGDPVQAVAAATADARWLSRLEGNPAFRFDPAVYRPLLDRVRFEVATRREAPDPAPPADAGRFARAVAQGRSPAGWRALADSLRSPFLGEWARRRAGSGREPAGRAEPSPAALLPEIRAAAAILRREAADGTDWSAQWRRTSALVARGLAAGPAAGAGALEEAEMAELAGALDRPLPLRLARATIRLGPGVLAAADLATLEITVPAESHTWRSRAFPLGPAAPVGTGWVGDVTLDATLPLGARDALHCRVVGADGRTLLEATVLALADGEGPGSCARPRNGEGGSVFLRLEPGWWSALQLPPPPVPF